MGRAEVGAWPGRHLPLPGRGARRRGASRSREHRPRAGRGASRSRAHLPLELVNRTTSCSAKQRLAWRHWCAASQPSALVAAPGADGRRCPAAAPATWGVCRCGRWQAPPCGGQGNRPCNCSRSALTGHPAHPISRTSIAPRCGMYWIQQRRPNASRISSTEPGSRTSGQTRGSILATSTSAITSRRAWSCGSCASTSTASSSTTTPYRIPDTPVLSIRGSSVRRKHRSRSGLWITQTQAHQHRTEPLSSADLSASELQRACVAVACCMPIDAGHRTRHGDGAEHGPAARLSTSGPAG